MKPSKANLIWPVLLILIFIRPFLCQMCYPRLDLYYSLAFLVFALLNLRLKPRTHRRNPLRLPLLLFSLSLVISMLFSVNIIFSLSEIYKFALYLVALYLMDRVSTQQKKEVLLTLVAAGLVLSLYAIYQFFWGFSHILDYLNQTGPDVLAQEFLARNRTFASFFSPDMFAGYLIIIIPLTLGLFLDTLIKKHKLLYLFTGLGLLSMLIALLLSKSLGGWISLLFALLVFALFLFISCPDLRPKVVPVTIIAGIIISIVLAVTLIGRAGYLLDKGSPHNSIIQRWHLWKAAVNMIKDFPLIGIGLGNFGLIYPYYKVPQAIESNFVHNSYLQIWIETGILGIVSIGWLVVSWLKSSLINLKNQTDKVVFTGLIAATFAFLLHNLVDFSFFVPEVALIWWVVLGGTLAQGSSPGMG